MRRAKTFLWIPTLLVLFGAGTAPAADWDTMKAEWHAFWNRVKLDTHRNNSWPEPFMYSDRQTVYAHYAAQTAKGWKLQTTLGHQFFDANTHELNQAGVIQLHWIATGAPANRRMVHVLRTSDPRITRQRMASVEQTLAKMLPDQEHPAIVQTDIAPPSFSADMVDKMWEMRKSSVPSPVLPASSGGP